MRTRSSIWAAPLVALAAGLAAAFTACGTDLEVDLAEFCREKPTDAACAGAGAAGFPGGGGAAGRGGGVAGQGPQQGASGGLPQQGASGSAAGGGAGGAAGGGCADTQVDANNCGECGRVCLGGGACQAGACVPQTLADAQIAPYALAIDSANVYWASPAVGPGGQEPLAVAVKNKTGVGGISPLVSVGDTASEIQARGFAFASSGGENFVFIGSLGNDTLFRFNLDAPGTQPGAAQVSDEGINRIVTSGDRVYWTSLGSRWARGESNFGITNGVVLDAEDQSSPGWLAVDAQDGGRPYWVANNRVRRQESLGNPDDFEDVVTQGTPIAVELAGGVLYWADRAAGALRSSPTSAALPIVGQTITADSTRPIEGFAVDAAASRIYWVSVGPTGTELEVYRAGLDGQGKLLLGKVALKADGYQGNPFGASYVVLDNEAVYFADVGTVVLGGGDTSTSSANGVVYRVAR